MTDLPALPKRYLLLARGVICRNRTDQPVLALSREGDEWLQYGSRGLNREDWEYNPACDPTGGPYYAIPKPRYTCPLEFSRYV